MNNITANHLVTKEILSILAKVKNGRGLSIKKIKIAGELYYKILSNASVIVRYKSSQFQNFFFRLENFDEIISRRKYEKIEYIVGFTF